MDDRQVFGGRALRGDGRLRRFGQLLKDVGIGHGQFREHLAIEYDAGFLQTVNKLTVAEIVESCCCVNALDPQGPEVTLAVLSSHIGKTQRALNLLDDLPPATSL